MMAGSDILFTTVPVITDWPISDNMIRTSHRGPLQRSVFLQTQRAPDRGAALTPGARTACKYGRRL
ncbi:unnamed protein product [Staurois parvus]|uniref:Uncharacterized protein n=1 Tax=Staurois parvus TaxID=386267 RepID=A0ABN9CF46_9NEOB|nr:unnamed protein product [Staurois parvus]